METAEKVKCAAKEKCNREGEIAIKDIGLVCIHCAMDFPALQHVEKKTNYHLTLKWSGRPDTPLERAALAYCKSEIPICKDTCQFVTYDEYRKLIENDQIQDDADRSYWRIEEGQIGVVCSSYYAREYQLSWDNMSNCHRDYIAGYMACEKLYQHDRDWDEALEFHAEFISFRKLLRRKLFIDITHEQYSRSIEDRIKEKHADVLTCVYRADRRGNIWLTLEVKLIGIDIENWIRHFCDDYMFRPHNFFNIPIDPKDRLNHWYKEPEQHKFKY